MEKSKDTWTVLSSEYLHRAPWLTVRKDHVVLPNGNHIPSYYLYIGISKLGEYHCHHP